ncbi:Cupin domain protein [Pelotomaculum sp. FP]|uniref:cupin domain-containing protein n=1 Tax=Pelotomaculum sp. FP TaxID=261474 RepID=UPI001066A05A|nr:cupin domain-containing protein [Pelotomaculum sp. FP]TEB17110.1 Cupin domain protein [Pelotomaculum sp. FP]
MFKNISEAPKKTPYLPTGEKVEGVLYQTLAFGKEMMITTMIYEKDAIVPAHAHPQEQAGFVVSGRIELTIGDDIKILNPLDSYVILGGVLHSAKALNDSLAIDVFSPPREDYKD